MTWIYVCLDIQFLIIFYRAPSGCDSSVLSMQHVAFDFFLLFESRHHVGRHKSLSRLITRTTRSKIQMYQYTFNCQVSGGIKCSKMNFTMHYLDATPQSFRCSMQLSMWFYFGHICRYYASTRLSRLHEFKKNEKIWLYLTLVLSHLIAKSLVALNVQNWISPCISWFRPVSPLLSRCRSPYLMTSGYGYINGH